MTPDEGAEPLEISVLTSIEAAGAVNSVLLIGEDEVVVVDAQFTKSGAQAVADAVEQTGKPLTRVLISHAHPDHYLGTAVLAERFPDAQFVASPDVVAEMNERASAAAEANEAMLGPEFPGTPIIPTALSTQELEVGGHVLELLSGLQGDTHGITAVWVEEQGVLIASDIGFSGVHAWTATTDQSTRLAWTETLEALHERPGLERVIPGHQLQDASQDPALLLETRDYLIEFNRAVDDSDSAEALIQAMLASFPELGAQLFLQLGAGAAFPG